jgi:hypothetical protein
MRSSRGADLLSDDGRHDAVRQAVYLLLPNVCLVVIVKSDTKFKAVPYYADPRTYDAAGRDPEVVERPNVV